MSWIRHLFNFDWARHSWRPRVTSFETLTFVESDMWARDVYRDYVRCDKQYVCEDCGAVRKEMSCLCDKSRADRCPVLREYLETSARPVP